MNIYECEICGKKYLETDVAYNKRCTCGVRLEIKYIPKGEEWNKILDEINKQNKTPILNNTEYKSEKKQNIQPNIKYKKNILHKKEQNQQLNNLKYDHQKNQSLNKEIKRDSEKITTDKNKNRSSVNVININNTFNKSLTQGNKENPKYNAITQVNGTVLHTGSNSFYKRGIIEKITDGLKFQQHFSDICNIIDVQYKNIDGKIQVQKCLFYGTVEGGVENIRQGASIQVYGKKNNNGDFICSKIFLNNSLLNVKGDQTNNKNMMIPFIIIFAIAAFIQIIRFIHSGTFIKFLAYFIISFITLSIFMGKLSKAPFSHRFKGQLIASICLSIILMLIL